MTTAVTESPSLRESLGRLASTQDALDNYIICEELGRGSFSLAHRVIHLPTDTEYALKEINKRYVSQKGWVNLEREIEIMLTLSHPNVLKMKEFFETQDRIYMVLELMRGGELFTQIEHRGSFGEKDASRIVRQIVSGVGFLHDNGVAHRDLKPENLLCSGPSTDDRIVVADFGLAKIFGRGELLRTHCGTPHYAAPEVVRGDTEYSKACDMWSLGVITFVLLSGTFPFFHRDQELFKRRIISGEYSFRHPRWNDISPLAKDFIQRLLVLDPALRMSAHDCLRHPWLQESLPVANTVNLRESLEGFQQERRLLRESVDKMLVE